MAVAGVWVLRKAPDATLSAQSLRRTTDPDIGDPAMTTVLAVSGEELFVVSGATAQPAQRASLAETDLVAQISSPSEFAVPIADAPNLARKMLVGLAGRLRAADLQLAT